MRANNQAQNKVTNKNLILKKIITSGGISRVELARFAGLTKMTVTNIVNELLAEGYITEKSGGNIHSVGRTPITLTASKKKYIIGIYLNRDYVEVFVGDICGKIFEIERTGFSSETQDSITSKIISSADRFFEKYPEIYGFGISAIGPVDSKKGIILNPPNFFNIKNFDIASRLKDRYHLPVYMDNDMNTSAVAEKYWGYAKDESDYIYMGASNGIGAGIILDGRLSGRILGEIGHVSIDVNGPLCHCGNRGCLELYSSIPNGFSGEGAEEICKYLAYGATTLINLFNPQAIYFGHRIPSLGEDAAEKIGRYMEDSYLTRTLSKPKLSLSKFGKKSSIYGAIAIFIERHKF